MSRPEADAPAFAEPWQAQAFALAVGLNERGLFGWGEWAEALSREIAVEGEAADGARYYESWLAALEAVLIAKGATDKVEIDRLAAAWARAAENTPHGQPIELGADALDADAPGAVGPGGRRG